MRLTPEEVTAIKAATAEVFGPEAVVRLFGSRLHDHLRGGDIDLHVEVEDLRDDQRQRFVRQLHGAVGERSIDVLIDRLGAPAGRIGSEALRTGVVL